MPLIVAITSRNGKIEEIGFGAGVLNDLVKRNGFLEGRFVQYPSVSFVLFNARRKPRSFQNLEILDTLIFHFNRTPKCQIGITRVTA